jgi:hypothetical protein
MTDEGKILESLRGVGGDATPFGKDTSVIESKVKLWTAIVTLLAVLLGLLQLYGQGKDLQKIERNFSSLENMRRSLMMPLEGVWSYHIDFVKYFGETEPRRYADGKAAFVWNGGKVGYDIIVGAGVKGILDPTPDPFVTYVFELFMGTDPAGIPQDNGSAHGQYLSRTTSNPKFGRPNDPGIDITNCMKEYSTIHTITGITCKYSAKNEDRQTDANLRFGRLSP